MARKRSLDAGQSKKITDFEFFTLVKWNLLLILHAILSIIS